MACPPNFAVGKPNMTESQQLSSDNIWIALCNERLLDNSHLLITRFLTGLSKTDKAKYKLVDVHLNGCKNFPEVAGKFNKALFNMKSFGENGDALFDILTDLPEGKYIFHIYGLSTQPKAISLKLKGILSARREGGIGYGMGEAIFIIH